MSGAVFLDHAAGSPLRVEVAEAMASSLAGLPPNPSGSHQLARRTRALLEDARDRVAALLGCSSRSVVFCSGGTESCNLALRARSTRVLRSSIEHAAVREASPGAIELPVDAQGLLLVEAAADAVRAGDLISIMAANNETGAIQPLDELARALGAVRAEVLVHSDAVAAASCLELSSLVASCDLVSIAAAKLGGPAGSGALIVGADVQLEPLLRGGGQERGQRAGTQHVAGAVGLAAALELAAAERRSGALATMAARRDRLEAALLAIEGAVVSSASAPRLASHSHLTIEGLRSEELLVLLDRAGICASAGAACASGAPRPSQVLLAMGFEPTRARAALRFSLASTTSDAEIDLAAAATARAVAQLRS